MLGSPVLMEASLSNVRKCEDGVNPLSSDGYDGCIQLRLGCSLGQQRSLQVLVRPVDRTRALSQSDQLFVCQDKPKAVLTLEPPGGEIFTGDRVTLSCGVGGDPAGWKYLWYKDRQGTALPQTDSSSVEWSSYTISSAALSHSGEYWCRAGRGNGLLYSEYSDSVVLKVASK
ncbi:UNVERIFIED_CONTAM: hypothetical protein FKN15_055475 [Acipenser sinensis]